jgi:hypothetical protein
MQWSSKWVVVAALAASSVTLSATVDVAAQDEMLRDANGQQQIWTAVPELVVLTSVMQYQTAGSRDYVATSEILSATEAQNLVDDLRTALRQLTDNPLANFAAIHYETVPTGSRAAIVRPKQIVVGRFQGLADLSRTLGFGGRTARRGEIVGGAILLDEKFDRTSDRRRLSRTHELGHALGFNHVKSRVSIMNERIGPEVTPLDRQIGLAAFQRANLRASN